jgi:chromosomal replication initiation ATPase DnaA
MSQLGLDLPYRPALGRADFLVSASNAAALGWIERWPDWPSHALVLHGPEGCGKSHLAHLWCERAGARLISGRELTEWEPIAAVPGIAVDDADRASEIALLHLYNSCAETSASLLLVARSAPSAWPIALPDLASRLRAAPAIGVVPPDDALLAAVFVKHFADRQLRVQPPVIAYLVRRMERSFAAAAALAVRLDQLALAEGRPIGLALARRVLAEIAARDWN